MLVRLLDVPSGGDVLEVGCGRGVALPALLRHLAPASLTGLDLSRCALAAARQAGPAPRLVEADVLSLPFADASFDLVVDFGTCHHLPVRGAALAEIARVLKPNGLLVHETALAQAVAHPLRFRRRPSPWQAVPGLLPQRRAGLWTARRKSPCP